MSGIFIRRLVSRIPQDCRVTVLTPDGRLPFVPPDNGYKVEAFQYAPKKWQILAHEPGGVPMALHNHKSCLLLLIPMLGLFLYHSLRLARKSDIIHAHWSINGVIGGLSGILTGTPVLSTLRGEDISRAKTSFIYKVLLSICLRLSARCVTVSSTMEKELVAEFPDASEKIQIIPNGIDETLYELPFSKHADRVRILVLGNLIPLKGVDTIIKALAILEKGETPWQLTIAGEGSEQVYLQRLVAKAELTKQIHFIGRVAPEKITALFAETDILVQASHREGRPNAVLEAMAAGKTVIGSDIDGINELITDEVNGLLFPAGNPEQLALHLQRSIKSNTFRKELGQAARQTMLDMKLSWNNCAAAYTDLYNQIRKRSQGGSAARARNP